MKVGLVSFVIRTKNEEKFIGKVLQYLYSQSYKNIEVIIVDSGSTDKTMDIVTKYPIKLIKIKPKDFNYSYALNLGISKAKGEIIAIISGHSIPISDNWLESGLKYFSDNNVAAVTGPSSEIPLGYFNRSVGRLEPSFYGKPINNCEWMNNTNALIRKSLWKKYQFDEKLPECEDYDWALEMLERGYNIVREPKFGVFHSHYLLGRPGYIFRIRNWKRLIKEIKMRKRPII